MSNSPNDRQVGGTHYKSGGEEHWDRVYRLNLDYHQGQITKYVERWKLKNGIEDLRKAQHFLEKYIALVEGTAKLNEMMKQPAPLTAWGAEQERLRQHYQRGMQNEPQPQGYTNQNGP